METFNCCPLRDPEPKIEYVERIKEVKFGDGYEQVAPDGLNSMSREFKSFTYSRDTAPEVLAFFLRHGRSKAFLLNVMDHKALVRFSENPSRSLKTGRLTIEMKEVFR